MRTESLLRRLLSFAGPAGTANHETGQHRAENTLAHQRRERILYVRRLVKLVAQVNIVGNQRSKTWNAVFYLVHYREGRSVRALRDREINGAPSIDQRVSCQDVTRIGNRADVMQEYRRTRANANGKVSEFLNVRDYRVDRDHWLQVAGTDISSGHNDVAGADRSHYFFRRHVV